MRRMLETVLVLLCAGLAGLPAQDDILAVEKPADSAARDRLAREFAKVRFSFHVEEVTPADLCRYFGTVAGGKINFLWRDPEGSADVEPISLRIRSASLLQAMAAVQAATGLRFVYRSGIVFLTPADQVRPLTYLVMYDLRGPTRRIRNFPGPEIGLSFGEEQILFPEEDESTTTVSGFTAENVEDMLRTHITPDAWDSDGVSMSNADGLFMIRHTRQGHRQIRTMLYRMGVLLPPRVVVRRPATPLRAPRRR